MAAPTTKLTTWRLPWGSYNYTQSLEVSVVGMNPTATTVAFCGNSTTSCDWSMTIGPWAEVTPPPGGDNGVYDQLYTYWDGTGDFIGKQTTSLHWTETFTNDDGKIALGTSSVHCDIVSATHVAVCTEQNTWPKGIIQDEDPMAFNYTYTNLWPNSTLYSLSTYSITITAGLENLGAAATASPTGTTMSTSGSHPGSTVTAPGASSTATAHNAAWTGKDLNMGTLGLVGLVAAFLVGR